MRAQKTTMRDRHSGQYFGSQRSEYQMQDMISASQFPAGHAQYPELQDFDRIQAQNEIQLYGGPVSGSSSKFGSHADDDSGDSFQPSHLRSSGHSLRQSSAPDFTPHPTDYTEPSTTPSFNSFHNYSPQRKGMKMNVSLPIRVDHMNKIDTENKNSRVYSDPRHMRNDRQLYSRPDLHGDHYMGRDAHFDSDIFRVPTDPTRFSEPSPSHDIDSSYELDRNVRLTSEFTRFYPDSKSGMHSKWTHRPQHVMHPGSDSFELALLAEQEELLRKLYHHINRKPAQKDISSRPHYQPKINSVTQIPRRQSPHQHRTAGVKALSLAPTSTSVTISDVNTAPALTTNLTPIPSSSSTTTLIAIPNRPPSLVPTSISSSTVTPIRTRKSSKPTPSLNLKPSPSLNLKPSPSLNLEPSPSLNLKPSPSLNLKPSPSLNLKPSASISTPAMTMPRLSRLPVSSVAPRSGYAVPRSGFAVPRSRSAVPRSGYVVPRSGFAVPRSGFAVPRSGSAVAGSGSVATIVPPPGSSRGPVLPPRGPPRGGVAPPRRSIAPRSVSKSGSVGGELRRIKDLVSSWMAAMNKLDTRKRMVFLARMFANDKPRTNNLLRIVAKLDLRPCIVTAQMVSEAQHLALLRQINAASSAWTKRKSSHEPDGPSAKRRKVALTMQSLGTNAIIPSMRQ